MASEAKLLSAAERASARAVYADNVAILRAGQMLGGIRGEELCRWLGRVLAHLDALTAGPVPDTLGAFLRGASGRALREGVTGFAADDAVAMSLYIHGRAAGRAEGEEERAQLQAIIDGEREGHEELAARRDATIARLTAELAATQTENRRQVTMINDLGAEIQGHAAELIAERALAEELRAMETEAIASADRWKAIAEARAAELVEATTRRQEAEALVAGMSAAVVEANRDGARVEREAFGDAAQRLTNGPAPSDTKRAIRAWVEDLCVLREKIADKGGEGGAG